MAQDQDPVFLITGASTGIGAATARHAAEAGYRLVLSARSEDKLAALAEELGGERRASAVPGAVKCGAEHPGLVRRPPAVVRRTHVARADAGLCGPPGMVPSAPLRRWA